MEGGRAMDPAEVLTLTELVRLRETQTPERTAYLFLRDGLDVTEQISYGTLASRARAIASALQARVAPGDRALLIYPPGLDFVCAFLGCLHAGVVAVPVNPPRGRDADPRLRTVVDDASPAVGLASSAMLPGGTVPPILADLRPGMTWLATDIVDPAAEADWQAWTPTGETVAHLQYTSGSTAAPTGVIVTHQNLLRNLLDMHRGWRHDADSVILSWLPHFHDMGLVYGVLEPLYLGIPGYLMPAIAFIQRPVRWLQAIAKFGVTHAVAPNFAYDLCTRKIKPADRDRLDLRGWRVAVNGAEPIRAETLKQFAACFAPAGFRDDVFCPGYGLAEATLKVTSSRRDEPVRFLAVNGEALDLGRVETLPADDPQARTLVGCGQSEIDTEVVIADPGTGRALDSGEVGEVWVGGSTVAAGYWNLPERTAACFAARLAGTGRGPFMRTGDLGFVFDGELFINGRLKDMLIIRGQNHYPQDIELTVEGCHAAFRENGCAAFAVTLDGEERLVVAQELEREGRTVDREELTGLARQAVAEAHEIGVYDMVFLRPGGIPRTSSGKIQRHACRRAYLDGTFGGRVGDQPS
jgi:acyl-CoA synthetase (AMP-forming)/AMP-acid ligase II